MSTDNVVKLSDSNFDVQTGNLLHKDLSRGITTVMVYADWCGHCQVAKPIYSKISKATRLQTRCANLDSEKYGHIIDKLNESSSSSRGLNIRGFPTFLQYKNGVFHRIYEGPSSDSFRLLRFVTGSSQY